MRPPHAGAAAPHLPLEVVQGKPAGFDPLSPASAAMLAQLLIEDGPSKCEGNLLVAPDDHILPGSPPLAGAPGQGAAAQQGQQSGWQQRLPIGLLHMGGQQQELAGSSRHWSTGGNDPAALLGLSSNSVGVLGPNGPSFTPIDSMPPYAQPLASHQTQAAPCSRFQQPNTLMAAASKPVKGPWHGGWPSGNMQSGLQPQHFSSQQQQQLLLHQSGAAGFNAMPQPARQVTRPGAYNDMRRGFEGAAKVAALLAQRTQAVRKARNAAAPSADGSACSSSGTAAAPSQQQAAPTSQLPAGLAEENASCSQEELLQVLESGLRFKGDAMRLVDVIEIFRLRNAYDWSQDLQVRAGIRGAHVSVGGCMGVGGEACIGRGIIQPGWPVSAAAAVLLTLVHTVNIGVQAPGASGQQAEGSRGSRASEWAGAQPLPAPRLALLSGLDDRPAVLQPHAFSSAGVDRRLWCQHA